MMFPPGEWSFLLVGDQWPDDQDLMALSQGKINRGQLKTGYVHFADMLRNAQTGPLAEQQGYTADDLRNAFRQGEDQARRVAEKNGVKESAYGTAYDSMVSLQHDLTDLANEGNQRIKEIQDSKEPVEAKVPHIVAAVQQYRALANLAAAKYSGNVLDAMQRILDEEATGQSARQFAQAHGLDVGQMFRQPEIRKRFGITSARAYSTTRARPWFPRLNYIDSSTPESVPPATRPNSLPPPIRPAMSRCLEPTSPGLLAPRPRALTPGLG